MYVIGHPESIFKFALSGSFKNTFRRLPRLACGKARNDEFPAREVLSGSLKSPISA
ncbi:MAG: hypothetical protein IKZ88_01280 [Neisseriaceae bacterium]|nr:hypothetical protein [Neisseriaceae bacterium]